MSPPSPIRGIFQYPRREVLQTFRSASKSQHNNELASPHIRITDTFGRTSSFTNTRNKPSGSSASARLPDRRNHPQPLGAARTDTPSLFRNRVLFFEARFEAL